LDDAELHTDYPEPMSHTPVKKKLQRKRLNKMKFVDLIVRDDDCYAVYVDEKGKYVWIPEKR